MAIPRGTNSYCTITMPVDTQYIDEFWVTFGQNDKEVVTKTKSQCTCDGKTVTVGLTQEDTLLFKTGSLLQVQVRYLTNAGIAKATKIKTGKVGQILKEGVIGE